MSERDDIAKSFHNIYLVTAKVFKWSIRPEVDVEFEELSKDAQELDYALADFHLAEIARLRAEVKRLNNVIQEQSIVIDAWMLKLNNRTGEYLDVKRERDEALVDLKELKRSHDELHRQVSQAVADKNEALAQMAVLLGSFDDLAEYVSRDDRTSTERYRMVRSIQARISLEARALLDRLRDAEEEVKKYRQALHDTDEALAKKVAL